MAEDTQIVEADIKNFEKVLQEKEERLKEADKKYLTRLAKEAVDAGVSMKEEDLIGIGEKGIIALIDQAKKMKPVEKKVEEKAQSKGIVVDTQEEIYEPVWAKGPIICKGNEMYREWDYDYFRGE